mmetsp:Transcript_6053/g.13495  ORF Transcript_6053/g.13495 Transcript_6053/m.13495 type:complete len:635 (+) Transcript_6053:1297-3201(+)
MGRNDGTNYSGTTGGWRNPSNQTNHPRTTFWLLLLFTATASGLEHILIQLHNACRKTIYISLQDKTILLTYFGLHQQGLRQQACGPIARTCCIVLSEQLLDSTITAACQRMIVNQFFHTQDRICEFIPARSKFGNFGARRIRSFQDSIELTREPVRRDITSFQQLGSGALVRTHGHFLLDPLHSSQHTLEHRKRLEITRKGFSKVGTNHFRIWFCHGFGHSERTRFLRVRSRRNRHRILFFVTGHGKGHFFFVRRRHVEIARNRSIVLLLQTGFSLLFFDSFHGRGSRKQGRSAGTSHQETHGNVNTSVSQMGNRNGSSTNIFGCCNGCGFHLLLLGGRLVRGGSETRTTTRHAHQGNSRARACAQHPTRQSILGNHQLRSWQKALSRRSRGRRSQRACRYSARIFWHRVFHHDKSRIVRGVLRSAIVGFTICRKLNVTRRRRPPFQHGHHGSCIAIDKVWLGYLWRTGLQRSKFGSVSPGRAQFHRRRGWTWSRTKWRGGIPSRNLYMRRYTHRLLLLRLSDRMRRLQCLLWLWLCCLSWIGAAGCLDRHHAGSVVCVFVDRSQIRPSAGCLGWGGCASFASQSDKGIARFKEFLEACSAQGIAIEQHFQQIDTLLAHSHICGKTDCFVLDIP